MQRKGGIVFHAKKKAQRLKLGIMHSIKDRTTNSNYTT